MSPYIPPVRYSDADLLAFELADLEVDLRCAVRDGLEDYAREVAALLNQKRKDAVPSTVEERVNARIQALARALGKMGNQ